MAKATQTSSLSVTFDAPTKPSDVSVLWQLPWDAKVTSIHVRYIQISDEAAAAKRHDAAVKANATRKARKAEQKGGAE